MSFTDREIRKEKKKERTANRKFTETNNDDYLRTADKHRENWMELERNQRVDQEKKNVKSVLENKTEDQLFNEAQTFNRKIRNEAEKNKKLQMEKEANIKKLRMNTKLLMKEKEKKEKEKIEDEKKQMEKFKKETNDQMIAFTKKMREEKKEYFQENIKTLNQNAYIQKAFRRYQFDRMKYSKMESKMKALFTMMGMDKQDVEVKFQEYIKHLKKVKESDPTINIDFELNDYLEGYNQTMIESKISDLEEPIPEEECVETQSSL